MLVKVGCCGYPTSTKSYYNAFRLVELNVTFYRYPRISTVEGWRRKAPEAFEFTIKAHQDLSHKFKLKAEGPCFEAFERMKAICKALRANVLLIQTPASFKPDELRKAKEFFENVNREGLIVAWETRGSAWDLPDVRKELINVLSEVNVVHVTDPLRAAPAYVNDIAYFRLHGLGDSMYRYQYVDEELKRVYDIVKRLNVEEAYILFNNLSMFNDALRLLRYLEVGSFPSVTGALGMKSVEIVIKSVRYPASKEDLIKKVGWKLAELEGGEQVRLSKLLKAIPSKIYGSVDEVLKEVRPLLTHLDDIPTSG